MAYTCMDYRAEMRLLGLIRQLKDESLTEQERQRLAAEVKKLEEELKMA